jgi:hypothetical protein
VNRSQILFCTLKTMPIKLQWPYFILNRFSLKFSLKWCVNCYDPSKNKGMALFFVYNFEYTPMSTKKTWLSPYFLTNFNNLHTILTRIVSVPRAQKIEGQVRPDCSFAPTQRPCCLRFAPVLKGRELATRRNPR